MAREKTTSRTRAAAASASAPPAGRRFRVRYVFYFALALMLFLSVLSYAPDDINVLLGGNDYPPENWIGRIGAWLSYELFVGGGLAVYVLLLLIVLAAVRAFLPGPPNRIRFLGGSLMMLLGAMLLLAIAPEAFAAVTEKLGLGRSAAARQAIPGGVIGQFFAAPPVEELGLPEGVIRRLIGPIGTVVTGWALFMAGMVMIYLADFHQFVRRYLAEQAAARPADDGAEPSDPPAAPRGRVAALAERLGDAEDRDGAAELPPDPAREGLLARTRAALAALKGRDQTAAETAPSPAVPVPAPAPVEAPELPEIPDPPSPPPAPARPVRPVPAPASAAPAEIVRTGDPNTRIAVAGEAVRAPGNRAEFVLPPLTMLSKGEESGGEDLESIARAKTTLQQTLDSFGVAGKVTGHISGPRVTRYEITLAPGVAVRKVTSIESNIKMDLAAKSVRILAPIPGRAVVGVEAPNAKADAVFMRQVMEAEAWRDSTAEIPIVLGKDVAGRPTILDLAKAPHLLIAGSTGSGKSVCMNTLIMSLLFRFGPEELRLILVDPKVVEMEDYRTLPHLITPVVNDSNKVPIALRWAVNEMEKRYHILAKAKVKNLRGFNRRPLDGAPLLDDDGLPIPDRMPLLVIIVDELADLMMTDAKNDVETSIARIAQKGRAAGIHIVIATQRPSTNIITGVIKANLPTKIAFRVGSGIDSRVILDRMGAETLLGRGDMLFLPPGSSDVERVQGAMVDDADIKKVVEFVSAQAPQRFDRQVVADEEALDDEADAPDEFAPAARHSDYGTGYGDPEEDDDELDEAAPIIRKYLRPGDSENFRRALEVVVRERKASTSYLQRRLKIGYNSAAELIDELEARGIIGPALAGGSKRNVLIFDEIEG